MGNLLTYSGLVTKVRAMQANLLTAEDFEAIASLHTVPEVVSYLKEKPAYSALLSEMEEVTLHRGDIEKILIQSLYGDYGRLYSFCGMNQRKFLKLYLKRYEVDLINYCLRIIFNHYEEPFDLNYKKEFFDKYSNLSIDRLITSSNIQEFIEQLKDTEYYMTLKKLYDAGAGRLYDYDLALNLYYFTSVWKEKKNVLKGKELESFTKDTGSKIDLLNLQWIYRAKKYFNMRPADIYALLIPIHYRLRIETLKILVDTETPEEYVSAVRGTYYAHKYDFNQSHTLEKIYADCLRRLYMADRRRNPYSIVSVSTYLFLKEEEIQKLTTALECIRYNLTAKETSDYLGGVVK